TEQCGRPARHLRGRPEHRRADGQYVLRELAGAGRPAGSDRCHRDLSVTIRNDSIGAGGGYAGDQVLTGLAVDGGGKFVDTNGIVIVTATGTYGTATRQI